MKNYRITEWCHHFIEEHVHPGDLCIDATMGNGNDTELLCRLAGVQGSVLAFDIQPTAIENTQKRLLKSEVFPNYRLILDTHEHMQLYASPGSVSCIVFNFGYLPGGDHQKSTHAASSVAAVKAGLELLRPGGLMSLCIYSGGDTGYEEKEALLTCMRALDQRLYLVIRSDYLNRANHPPVPVLIYKLRS